MPHLLRATSGHLRRSASGHLRLKAYYRLKFVDEINRGATFTVGVTGQSASEQLITVGNAWGSNYPPTGDAALMSNDSVNGNSGDPWTLWTHSYAKIYELQYSLDGIDFTPKTDGYLKLKNLPVRLSVGKSSIMSNATQAFVGIGTDTSLPSGSPCDWPTVFTSSTADGTGRTITDA